MGDMELQIFSERLKKLRNTLEITQKDFAEKIGITAAALSSYENNLKNPSIAVAKKIAEAFGVSIDWLCGLSDEKGLKPEIKTYRDVAIKILELLKIDSFPYKFQLDLFEEECGFISSFSKSDDRHYVRVIRLPEKPELLKFFETYEDLQKLLREKKIKQHVIDTWLDGALEELNEILINIPDGIYDKLPFDAG